MIERGYPKARPAPDAPAGARSFEGYDWYQGRTLTLAAGTDFQEVIAFNGRPSSLIVETRVNPVFLRLRDRGSSPGERIRFNENVVVTLPVGAEIVEAASVNGLGGEFISVTGLYGSSRITPRAGLPAGA